MHLAVLAAVLSWMVSGLVRHHAIRSAILDHPNERSSHTEPTPRGGGVGLLAGVIVALIVGAGPDLQDWRLVAALAGVALTGLVGWFDDRYTLGISFRLGVQILAGSSLLPLALLPGPLPAWLGAAAALWWVFWAVSAINVVNFMDGIDGLIGSQAIVFGVHLVLMGSTNGVSEVIGLAVTGAAVGFLIWNWAPARIFMGDVGSGPLGLLVVLGGLLLMREGMVGLVAAFLPLYPMFLDATVTLVRRARRRERVVLAHRSHFYQRLANGSWGHARVSILYAAAAAVGLAATHATATTGGLIITGAYLVIVPAAAWFIGRRALTRPRAR